MINEQDKQRIDWIRREAITVFELTKGYTPEQREQMGNMLFLQLEEMAGYVIELTGSLSATAELEGHEHEFFLDNESRIHGCECGRIEIEGKEYWPEDQVEKLLEEYREVIKSMIPIIEAYISRRSREYAHHKPLVNHAKSLIETTSKPEKQ